MANIIQQIEKARMTRELPDFNPGDTVVVEVKVVEGDRERTAGLRRRRDCQEQPRPQLLVHGAQDFARRRRGARVPDLQPVDQRGQREASRQRPSREAVLPARSVGQSGAIEEKI